MNNDIQILKKENEKLKKEVKFLSCEQKVLKEHLDKTSLAVSIIIVELQKKGLI